MEGPWNIISEQDKSYPRFRAQGKQIVLQLKPSVITPDMFTDNINYILDYLLLDVEPHDMVGIKIQNEHNVSDKAIGISFRRKDQLSSDIVLKVLEKVIQSNAKFNAYDKLIINVDRVHMPSGNGGGVKAKGRTLNNMSHIKRSIVTVKSRNNCLAHALVIAIAKLENDPNYTAYTKGWKIKTKVNELLTTTKINLSNGGGLQELQKFSDHFQNYRIVVYSGLNSNDIMYDSGLVGKQTIYLLYDAEHKHYNVITNITGCFWKV